MNYNTLFKYKLNTLKEQGSYRHFLEVNKSAQHFPNFYYTNDEGVKRSAINWCSNDYLCMSTHEDVIAKLSFVSHRSGTGSSGTRNISGTTIYHRELENSLSNWHNKEAALLFNGAYQANTTTLKTLGNHIDNLVFISDECNHASIIEGIKSSGNEKKIFKHNDLIHLENILQGINIDQPKLIVFESVYSMMGTIAPIKDIVGFVLLGEMRLILDIPASGRAVDVYIPSDKTPDDPSHLASQAQGLVRYWAPHLPPVSGAMSELSYRLLTTPLRIDPVFILYRQGEAIIFIKSGQIPFSSLRTDRLDKNSLETPVDRYSASLAPSPVYQPTSEIYKELTSR
jgi:hypothetical protein